jgi:putative endonuclease
MKTYFVYILKCSDLSYYVGVTNDVERRLAEHNSDYNTTCYTFSRRPIELLYYQTFQDPNKAIQFEKQLKGWSRRKKEALIRGDLGKLVEYSKSRSSTSSE